MQTALQILNKTFGYEKFRLNQEDIVAALIEGRDVLALMPTGGGKSLCYQIPAIIRPGVGVVVSPLIALMQDQVDAMNLIGVKAAFINSSLAYEQIRHVEQQLYSGELDLLYVAPERLLNQSFLNMIEDLKISLFAIDEAHCVSQWGHDFRPEYQQLSALHKLFPEVPRIALTATADSRTQNEIIEQLELENAARFINSFDRPNISYAIAEGSNSKEQLWSFIQSEYSSDAGIVYCLSRNKVEKTAEWLQAKGRHALPYHAGLSAEERQKNQQAFLRQDGVIIVATIAFGMGIDKPDVRFVAHLSLPKSIEAYYQETGRAGRDGQPSSAWMAYGLQDVILLRQMMQQGDGNEQYKRISQQKLDSMLGLCESTQCRRQLLLDYFDETLSEPCGNCDNCIQPPETWDATEAARQALSCVYRTGQRFGVTYVIDVLLGKTDQRIENNQHHLLSTFAIGTAHNSATWKSLFRQMIAQGLLYVDHENFGRVRLTESSRPLLKGEVSLEARKQSKKEKTKKTKGNTVAIIHQELFDALRALRVEIAKEQGVPPFVIFHDSTLIEMTEVRPTELTRLQYISGVGEKKLEKYGKQFLNVISQHPLPNHVSANLSDTVNETLQLIADDHSLELIAKKRNITISSVYGHVAKAIEEGVLDPLVILPIDETDYQLIAQTIDVFREETENPLRKMFEALGEQFDYGIIKCVQASESV
ncbi:MAG: DNA helicase RecQ [Kangiellaceae bacterium]